MKNLPTAQTFIDGILDQNRVLLSRAITLVESSKAEHQELAQEIIGGCLPHSGKSIRIGITGVPGVGKSTFIDTFGNYLVTEKNRKLAVLAVDPSSSRTKGSILGDKTRMEKLAYQPNAFIRPSPSAGALGGVAQNTRQAVILCEAAGFDTIIIETVGVGQSETAVHSMVDFFLLLMLAGAGDELQGIKRGIMEMADMIVINKADSGNEQAAKSAASEYRSALNLFPPAASGWKPKVKTCSATEHTGIADVWEVIEKYLHQTKENGHFENKRKEQASYWLDESINLELRQLFFGNSEVKEKLEAYRRQVINGEISAFSAARELTRIFSK